MSKQGSHCRPDAKGMGIKAAQTLHGWEEGNAQFCWWTSLPALTMQVVGRGGGRVCLELE